MEPAIAINPEEPFSISRIGVIMEPEPGNELEAEGVLNPAVGRARDGQLYLLPRLVAEGNYSRIGLARVLFNSQGDPAGVERLGVALEPQEPYEKNAVTGGGVEDPRLTYVEPLDCFVLTYTAFGPTGPRVAFAVSHDMLSWKRAGLACFEPGPADFNGLNNKDAVIFPRLVPDPNGRQAIALIHRPRLPGTLPSGVPQVLQPDITAFDGHRRYFAHESVWISYCDPDRPLGSSPFRRHHRLFSPRAAWEWLKVGAGAPPVLTDFGWLLLYHGVTGHRDQTSLRYSAGAIVLDKEQPEKVLYRSRHPILRPGINERVGIVPNVVFPTGTDRRTDLGRPDRLDVYFGMADDRIGAGTIHLPDMLPEAPGGYSGETPAS